MMKSVIICNPWHYHQTDKIRGGFDERVPHVRNTYSGSRRETQEKN